MPEQTSTMPEQTSKKMQEDKTVATRKAVSGEARTDDFAPSSVAALWVPPHFQQKTSRKMRQAPHKQHTSVKTTKVTPASSWQRETAREVKYDSDDLPPVRRQSYLLVSSDEEDFKEMVKTKESSACYTVTPGYEGKEEEEVKKKGYSEEVKKKYIL